MDALGGTWSSRWHGLRQHEFSQDALVVSRGILVPLPWAVIEPLLQEVVVLIC